MVIRIFGIIRTLMNRIKGITLHFILTKPLQAFWPKHCLFWFTMARWIGALSFCPQNIHPSVFDNLILSRLFPKLQCSAMSRCLDLEVSKLPMNFLELSIPSVFFFGCLFLQNSLLHVFLLTPQNCTGPWVAFIHLSCMLASYWMTKNPDKRYLIKKKETQWIR